MIQFIMTRYIYTLGLLLDINASAGAQTSYSEASDPEAVQLLKNIKKEYESFQSMEATFDLVLDLPGQGEEVQAGTIKQKGDKFMAKVADQEVYCDGKLMWLYLPSVNEVQINNYDKDGGADLLTPSAMMRIYEEGNFIYAITDQVVEKGIKLDIVEFKPIDKDSEYFKLRAKIDAKNKRIRELKVFSKDGSRYTLVIKSLIANPTLGDDLFKFDPKQYKDIYVEDLRID